MLEYRTGDATLPSHPYTCIAHIVNNIGAWGAGFVVSLATRYPWAREQYLTRHHSYSLGTVQLVNIPLDPAINDPDEGGVIVANLFAQEGLKDRLAANPPIRYVALAHCLRYLDARLPWNYMLQMPMIGSGLAGGDWMTIASIINAVVARPVLVFTLPIRTKDPDTLLSFDEQYLGRPVAIKTKPGLLDSANYDTLPSEPTRFPFPNPDSTTIYLTSLPSGVEDKRELKPPDRQE